MVVRVQTIKNTLHTLNTKHKKVKLSIPVTGRGGLWSCEMSRIPHCPDHRLTMAALHIGRALPSEIFRYSFLLLTE
jgi:hypothetical protein